jgi:hypothetical protein
MIEYLAVEIDEGLLKNCGIRIQRGFPHTVFEIVVAPFVLAS